MTKFLRSLYGTDVSHFGDLRLPDGDGPWPVVVVIHGGFWYAEYGLDLMDGISEDLCHNGFATWNIEYRRVGQPGGGWPGTLMDVHAAVEHLQELAKAQPIDTSRVITLGHSAGGHLALWLAGRHKVKAPFHGTPQVRVRGVVNLAGVSDLQLMNDVRPEIHPVLDFLGGTEMEVPERYNAASPAALLPLGVPQWVVHGTEDDRVPYEVSVSYVRDALAAGDAVEFITLPGVEHFQVISPTTPAWERIRGAVQTAFETV